MKNSQTLKITIQIVQICCFISLVNPICRKMLFQVLKYTILQLKISSIQVDYFASNFLK